MGGALIALLFGNKYPLDIPLLVEYGTAMSFYAIIFLVLSYLISLRRMAISYIMPSLAGLQLLLMGFFHADITVFVHIMLATSLGAALVLLPLVARRKPAVVSSGKT